MAKEGVKLSHIKATERQPGTALEPELRTLRERARNIDQREVDDWIRKGQVMLALSVFTDRAKMPTLKDCQKIAARFGDAIEDEALIYRLAEEQLKKQSQKARHQGRLH